jgi:kumamolisin
MSSRTALRGSYRQHSPQALRIGRPSPNERLEVMVILRRKEMPGHPWAADRYLDQVEFEALYGADPADIAAVETLASEHHLAVSGVDPLARSMTLSGAFRDLATFFGVDVEIQRLSDRTYRSRKGHIHVPEELSGRVIGVLGFDTRPVARSFKSVRSHGVSETSYTPPQIAEAYQFPAGAFGQDQTIALIELGGGYRSSDLKSYWQKLGIDPVNVSSISVGGAGNRPVSGPVSAGAEPVLDIEIAGSIAPRAKLAVYFAPNTDAGFLQAIHAAVYDRVRKPSVISISWGGPEDQWPRQTLDVFNQAFHDASIMGITIVCAVGDDGRSANEKEGKSHVDFPASSPWVIACGGTTFKSEGGTATETAWQRGTGSGSTVGSVSTFFRLPDYQADASVPLSTVRSRFAGRAIPDVVACADPAIAYSVLIDGKPCVTGGTSAVAPLWAGLTALLNEQLGTRVGFLNPLFYGTFLQHKALNNISGTNQDVHAHAVWHASTGMGSPNGQAMLNILRAIQQEQSSK